MFNRLDVLTVTSLLQRSVKPWLLYNTKHKQNKAFCKWFISKSKHIYIPHVLEAKTWIKADLKRYMNRHYDFSFWLVFAILGSLLPKSVCVSTPSRITHTLKTTLALYLHYYMVKVIFGRELGSSEHRLFVCLFVSLALQPSAGFGLLLPRGFLIRNNDAPQSVGLLWTSHQLVAETSIWQHTIHITDKHPCSRWDLNSRSR
jgi:hypothetical protein